MSNSRFLIVPWLRVRNLASHVMSKALKRLPGDWEEAYKTRPVLVETYVEKERYEGTCHKASNWEYLGETQGRGRNDRYHQNRLSRKSVNGTPSMNLSTHEATEGLGCLSTERGEDGYFLHDTVVFTTAGIPLGVLEAQTWAKEPEDHGKKAKRKQRPIEEKESYKWLRSLQATARAMKEALGSQDKASQKGERGGKAVGNTSERGIATERRRGA